QTRKVATAHRTIVGEAGDDRAWRQVQACLADALVGLAHGGVAVAGDGKVVSIGVEVSARERYIVGAEHGRSGGLGSRRLSPGKDANKQSQPERVECEAEPEDFFRTHRTVLSSYR